MDPMMVRQVVLLLLYTLVCEYIFLSGKVISVPAYPTSDRLDR